VDRHRWTVTATPASSPGSTSMATSKSAAFRRGSGSWLRCRPRSGTAHRSRSDPTSRWSTGSLE
jgi:hypothetical protein